MSFENAYCFVHAEALMKLFAIAEIGKKGVNSNRYDWVCIAPGWEFQRQSLKSAELLASGSENGGRVGWLGKSSDVLDVFPLVLVPALVRTFLFRNTRLLGLLLWMLVEEVEFFRGVWRWVLKRKTLNFLWDLCKFNFLFYATYFVHEMTL